MASEQDDVVYDHDIDDEDDAVGSSQDDDLDDITVHGDVLEEEEEEEDDLNSDDSSSVPVRVASSPVVTIAVRTPPSVTASDLTPDPKRIRLSGDDNKPPPQQSDDSRRLFQRLWTDEDEIKLLQGFYDYTTQRGGGGGPHHYDTALFYDQIKSKLQLDFNKNQLVEKLRRLKKKYRNVLDKISSGKEFSFKTSHDQTTFEISKKIWSSTGKLNDNLDDEEGNGNGNGNGNGIISVAANPNQNFNSGDMKVEHSCQKNTPSSSRKRARSRGKVMEENNGNVDANVGGSSGGGSVSGVVEEAVRSCLGPLMKELLASNAMVAGGGRGLGGLGAGLGIGGLAMNALPLGSMIGGGGGGETVVMDERWRKQHMLELEVYSKRLDLVQEQIRERLEELRSMGG